MYKQFEFDLARNSLKYIVQSFNIKEIHIPYYLCDVIRHTLFEIGCKPLFYHIDDNFMPDTKFPTESFILYPNYFGVFDKNVDKLVKVYPNIIIDNAHSYYSKPKGFACFNAKHKFFNQQGSYLWIKKEGANEEKEFLHLHPDVKKSTMFRKIHDKYINTNLIKLNIEKIYSPFCYPYLASTDYEADRVAEEYLSKGVTIYRYWNNLPKSYNEYKFYRRLVPIPLN